MIHATAGNRHANHGSFIVDGRGTILGFDQAMELLTQWPAVEIVGHHKELNLDGVPDSGTDGRSVPRPLYEGEIPLQARGKNHELTVYCRDGRRLDVEAAVKRLDGPGDRMLVTVLRMLTRSARNTGKRDRHGRDPLTGLQGRDGFSARMAAAFVSAATRARPLALILLDIDRLREVNDRLGPEAGDTVLQKIAGILRVAIEDDCRIARLGDDDFAVFLPESGRGEARLIAASLRSTIERFRFFPDRNDAPRITASLGSASFPADADHQGQLVERAREALDEARSMGRNRVWCYLRRPRVPVQVPVFFDGADALLLGYARDLSPSGIFLQTSASIDVGMRCALSFPLPGQDGRVHVVGRVVRTVHPQFEDDLEVRVPGLGVEFERFGGKGDRRAIEAFLHRHESESLRPEDGTLSV